MATDLFLKIHQASDENIKRDMKRYGRNNGSCCFVATVVILALGVLIIIMNVVNSIISATIGIEQFKSTVNDDTKHLYSVQPLR